MSEPRKLLFDLAARQVELDNVVYHLNEVDEFQANDGQWYVAFEIQLSCRQHQTPFRYTDFFAKQPALVPRDFAIRWLNYCINLCKFNAVFSGMPPTHSFLETFEAMKHEFSNPEWAEPISRNQQMQSVFQVLLDLFSRIDVDELESDVRATNPSIINFPSDDWTLSRYLTIISEFLSEYIGYGPKLIERHSLSLRSDMLFMYLQFLLTNSTIFPSDLFRTKEDIMTHHIVSFLFDLLTDRCSLKLFIEPIQENRPFPNPEAERIYMMFLARIPALANVSRRADITPQLARAVQELSQETKYNMAPSILTYKMDDAERMKYIYSTLTGTSTEDKVPRDVRQQRVKLGGGMDEARNLLSKFPTWNTIYTAMLEPMAKKMRNGYRCYEQEDFYRVLAHEKMNEHLMMLFNELQQAQTQQQQENASAGPGPSAGPSSMEH